MKLLIGLSGDKLSINNHKDKIRCPIVNSVSIDTIIVNYNSTEHTIKCINSVKNNVNVIKNKFIIVDNNSDDTPEKIAEVYQDIKLIRSSRNLGFGKAINIALKSCISKYILLLNPDTEIKDRSFSCIFDYMEKHSDVSVAGPMVLDSDGSLQGSARRFPTAWTSIFGRKSPLTRLFPNNPITKKEFMCFNCEDKDVVDVDWVSGACMIIRRKAIIQIGGFDERFFLYWEDTDLCKRIKEAGGKVIYYPKTHIFHSVGKSSEKMALGAILHFHMSCFKLFEKYAKMPIKILIPLAFAGLTARCLFVILLYAGNSAILTFRSKKSFEKLNMYDEANKKIKTLRIVSRLNIGGPSIHVALLSEKINPQRFETVLLKGTRSPSEGDMSYLLENYNGRVKNINELQREINLKNDLISLLKIFFILAKEKPNIVHTHMSKAGTIGRLAAGCYKMFGHNNLRIVHTFHGHVLEGYFSKYKSKIFETIERIIARFTDAIIAISQTQKWELTHKYRIAEPNKVHTINLGFNLSPFLYSNRFNQKFRNRIGIDKDTILIGIVGRLVPIKNHLMFINAAKLFIEKNSDIPVKFIIIGDGELKANLKDYADLLKLQDLIIFHGWEKNIAEVYSDLDILALTSMNEGTPVSLIEAMASSVPVITTGVGGVRDLLGKFEDVKMEDKRYIICERGILLRKGDYVGLANGLEEILKNKNSERTLKARQFVMQYYSDSRLVESMQHLYESIIMSP